VLWNVSHRTCHWDWNLCERMTSACSRYVDMSVCSVSEREVEGWGSGRVSASVWVVGFEAGGPYRAERGVRISVSTVSAASNLSTNETNEHSQPKKRVE
jgi:hypothetical protein